MGIASLGGILSGTGNVSAPDTSGVGNDFASLMGSYLGEQGNVYANEAQYQPQYTALGVSDLGLARQGNVNQVGGLSPQIMSILRGYNPQQAGLLDTLTSQAQQQLALNGALDPATQRTLEQNVRGSQASRGLGYGPGDAATEAFYQAQTQEARRAQNQAFAGNVATQTANTYRDPFSIMLGYSNPVNPGPSITSTGTLASFMGIPYQGRLSAATSTAANNTGLYESMDKNQTQFMSGLMGML